MFTANYSESCPLEEETAFCVCGGTFILRGEIGLSKQSMPFFPSFFFWQNVFIYIEQIGAS